MHFCCCSVTQSCLTLCDPMDCSTPGSPVLHYLPEFAQKMYIFHQNLMRVKMSSFSFLTCKSVIKSLSFVIPSHFQKGFPDSSVGKESACNAGDPGLIPGSGRSPGEGIGYPLQYSWASFVAQLVKNPPEMQETWVWSLGLIPGLGRFPGEGRATRSSILAWRIPWRSPWGHKELDMTERLSKKKNLTGINKVTSHCGFDLHFPYD